MAQVGRLYGGRALRKEGLEGGSPPAATPSPQEGILGGGLCRVRGFRKEGFEGGFRRRVLSRLQLLRALTRKEGFEGRYPPAERPHP